MVKLEVKNLQGEKVEDIELEDGVFGLEVKQELLHEVFVAQSSNKRQSTSHTKGRGERAGSTRKPWKQKGTGRARTGSIRNPIWKKGGVVFGPTNERNFKKKINRKVLAQAIKMALSSKILSSQLIVVDNFKLDQVKTKQADKGLSNLKIGRGALLALTRDEIDFARASRNLTKVDGINLDNLNVYELLNHRELIVSKQGIEALSAKYIK